MYTESDILARLQAGEDAQKIADEMAAVLNAANKTYTDQKIAEAEAAKKNEKKLADMQDVLDTLKYYYVTHVAKTEEEVDEYNKAFNDLDPADICKMLEAVEELAGTMKIFEDTFGTDSLIASLLDYKPVQKKAKKVEKINSAEDKIADFLKKMNW